MVSFYSEDIDFDFSGRKRLVSKWLKDVAVSEGKKLGDISVVFCSDPYILDINVRYLGHEYYTDIITFDYCDGNVLNGDLFISIDTVKANADEYGSTFHEELHRVIVHGVLHLIGYDDHTEADVAVMRSKENEYLKLVDF